MKMAGLSRVTGSPETKFTYNGKELEDDFNLNWYHYGARYYDPQLGRWLQVDPVDEFHSPYVYVGNNPVMFVDPDGAVEQAVLAAYILQVNAMKYKDAFHEDYERILTGDLDNCPEDQHLISEALESARIIEVESVERSTTMPERQMHSNNVEIIVSAQNENNMSMV